MNSIDEQINYTKEAFLNPWNLVFIVVGLVTAFLFSGSETVLNAVLVFTAAIELLYLGVMPRQERFRRVVRAKKAAERHKPPSQKEIYQTLRRRDQRRYVRLRNLEESIRDHYAQLSYASQGLLESHLQKINGLLDSYLKLLKQKERYEEYANSATENEVVRSIAALRENLEDSSSRVRSVKERRLNVLERRLQRFKKSRENEQLISAQVETIEDVVKYIHEQSMTLHNPEEITFQLDTLLNEVQETRASIEEIEEVFTGHPYGAHDELDESFDELESLDFELEKETSRSSSSSTSSTSRRRTRSGG